MNLKKADYGLELTNNSKTGYAFSISRSSTCINATTLCKQLCYGNGVRYRSKTQKEKRQRNYLTSEFLLKQGGPSLLSENLQMLVDQARPRDWLASTVSHCQTSTPWTLRIHDVGDFYSTDYIEAWILTVESRPECSFWFYTRSFRDRHLLRTLTRLSIQPNCQGWLSADSENYEEAILAKCTAPGAWKLALLQDRSLLPDTLPLISMHATRSELINFPYHHGGRHIQPLPSAAIPSCPAVTGLYKLVNDKNTLRPCQSCKLCLPVSAG